MNNTIPRNGPLSGMIITAAAALILPAIALDDSVRSFFDRPLGDRLPLLFLASAVVMAAHKYESYRSREFDVCPVYHTQGDAWGDQPRRAIFLSFVTTFVGMLLLLALALIGPPWHLAIVGIWIAHGLHELHHGAKSLARHCAYPGVITSLVFVFVQWGLLYPAWYDALVGSRDEWFALSYLLLPAAFVGFYFEDRAWIARAPRPAWTREMDVKYEA